MSKLYFFVVDSNEYDLLRRRQNNLEYTAVQQYSQDAAARRAGDYVSYFQ